MGLIAILRSFTRVTRNGAKQSDVKVDPGGGQNVTAEHFADAGDDSFPLPTDYALIVPNARTGGAAALGYADPLSTPVAVAGEKRIYGRNAAGTVVNSVHLKADGAIETSNANCDVIQRASGEITAFNALGSITLQADGAIETSNANCDVIQRASGEITAFNALGSITLQADGTVNINGVIITPTGEVSSPVSITALSMLANGKELSEHTHPAGTPPGDTGVNN